MSTPSTTWETEIADLLATLPRDAQVYRSDRHGAVVTTTTGDGPYVLVLDRNGKLINGGHLA